MGDFSWKELVAAALSALGAFGLVVWLTLIAVNYFSPSDPNDPLTRAGGLKPEQLQHGK